jgi:hypothetical protein
MKACYIHTFKIWDRNERNTVVAGDHSPGLDT